MIICSLCKGKISDDWKYEKYRLCEKCKKERKKQYNKDSNRKREEKRVSKECKTDLSGNILKKCKNCGEFKISYLEGKRRFYCDECALMKIRESRERFKINNKKERNENESKAD